MPELHIPQIRIKDAWLLKSAVSEALNELWGDGSPLRSDEEYAKIVESYEKAWKPLENKVLSGMCEIIDLEFRQEIIDVYIAPWFKAISDPMVIGVTLETDEFIDVLTHELIHRLLTDNTLLPIEDKFLVPEWEKLFGGQHAWNTLIHIPVHAIHQAIYCDVLKDPQRMERDINSCKKHNDIDYVKSWEYVEQNDYKKIIKKLRYSYTALSKDVTP